MSSETVFGGKGQTLLINALDLEHNHRTKGSNYLQFRNSIFILTIENEEHLANASDLLMHNDQA